MDRHGEGVPVIFAENRERSGRVPEYPFLDDRELLLIVWSSDLPELSTT